MEIPLKLNQSNVKNAPPFTQMLENLQANILKGHGRDFAFHLFFSFDRNKAEQAKAWIADFARNNKITSAKQQLDRTREFKLNQTDGGPIVTLSLSAHGYRALGLDDVMPKASQSFLGGMRADKDKLLDDTDRWTAGFNDKNRPVDMMILVADDDLVTASTLSLKLTKAINLFAHFLLSQMGKGLKKKGVIGGGIEHFGYADGISQPLYLDEDIKKQQGTDKWDDKTNLDRLLVKDGPADVDSFGSYLVFRKLEQDVKKFKEAEGDDLEDCGTPTNGNVVPCVINEKNIPDRSLGGSMVVGRHEDGTPVELHSLPQGPQSTANNFNYGLNDISRCPFFAHTRIMNPRDGDSIAGDVSAQRITRRGIPYDDIGRFPQDVIEVTDEMLNDNQPSGGVGLLFMCYQSNIDSQFLILQQHWANDGNIAGHHLGTDDAIISQAASSGKKVLPVKWGQPALNDAKAFDFPHAVTNRGGEYLFTPSIAFLKSLNNIPPTE